MDKIFSYIHTDLELEIVETENKKIKIEEPLEQNINHFKGDTSFLINSVEILPPSRYEIKMLEGTRNSIQQLEAEEKEEPVQVNERRIFIEMVKVIALTENGYSPIDNPSTMYNSEKKKILKSMETLVGYPYETIKEKFNEVCNEQLFTPKADYSQYPVISQ